MATPASAGITNRGVMAGLLPIVTMVFLVYLVTGASLPVLPLHVHQTLGRSAFVFGLVSGAQFTACAFSRFSAGGLADRRGGKPAVLIGRLVAASSGLLYLLSLAFVDTPIVSIVILLVARAALGVAESFILTGAIVLGLAVVAAPGIVFAWIGTAMYVGFAVGAPLGDALYGAFGFAGISIATTVAPLATLLLVAREPARPPPSQPRRSMLKVIGAVWLPGVGLALGCAGFGAVTTFVVLFFEQHQWAHSWLALTVTTIAFAGARIWWGHLPDKIGGARVAVFFLLLEAAGQLLIWLAPWSAVALCGAALTGLGFSLVTPALGVEALRRAPPGSHGLGVGAFTAFFDIGLGLAGPTLGLVATALSIDTVFLVSTLSVLCASFVALRLVGMPLVAR